MDTDRLLDLLLEAAMLKRVPRSGWAMRGVPHVESVAEHSFGVALVALSLADGLAAGTELASPLDVEQVLAMAVLHDLAEVRLMDLPVSAARLMPPGLKMQAEAAALAGLLAPLPGAGHLLHLWQAYQEGSSPEARLVRDADKLEMMIQCLRYEQAGSRDLGEFWQAMDEHDWHYTLASEVYEGLRARRSI
jgi:putative hydrolase of HD superfamily